jgi:Protein of unknown function (DUF2510)
LPPSEPGAEPAAYSNCEARDDVRHYLEVSSAHLPDRLSRRVDRCPGVLAWPHDLGAYIYVPANAQELRETESKGCPPELLHLFRYAMDLECSLIDLGRDFATNSDLPTYDGNKRASAAGPPQWREPQAEGLSQPPPSPPGPPPGWYGDPARQARLRWWDGYNWTGHTSG